MAYKNSLICVHSMVNFTDLALYLYLFISIGELRFNWLTHHYTISNDKQAKNK